MAIDTEAAQNGQNGLGLTRGEAISSSKSSMIHLWPLKMFIAPSDVVPVALMQDLSRSRRLFILSIVRSYKDLM
jgi:hypothetical protein